MSNNKSLNNLNLLFMGNFPYPEGMAGTKRIQHAIDALKNMGDTSIRVVLQRGSTKDNPPSGIYDSTTFEIVMPDTFRVQALLLLPMLWLKTIKILNQAYKKKELNILYIYFSPQVDNFVPAFYAKWKGWKVVYDIVEDDNTSSSISSSLFHKLSVLATRVLNNNLGFICDGIIVITSHLNKKFSELTDRRIPILLRSISVDLSNFPEVNERPSSRVILFYAGSFGVKDGVENLIGAFDRLAGRFDNLSLVLTGKGTTDRMNIINSRIASSPFRARIDYKGYLSDDDYYQTLNLADIPCMTRTDTDYANAGFPFKLGEFLATGKPVVVSACSDVEDFLSDRLNAMLVAPGLESEIVSAIQYLLENPEEASKIGAGGRKVAETSFDYLSQGYSLRSFFYELFST